MWPEALAHVLPFAHGAASDPYIVLGLLGVGVLVSLAAGMLAGNAALAPRSRTLAAAVAAGALLFLLFDLLKESAGLGQGLVLHPLTQAGLVAAFALGLVLIAAYARDGDPSRLAWAWALGIAAHGAGEAWIVGTEALTAGVAAPAQAASFLIHKAIEGATIPLVAGAAMPRVQVTLASAALATLAVLSGALGFALGPGSAPTFLFATGAGAATFAILALAKRAPLDLKHGLAVALGVALVYAAGLLHEVG